jgi:hypothetical protein
MADGAAGWLAPFPRDGPGQPCTLNLTARGGAATLRRAPGQARERGTDADMGDPLSWNQKRATAIHLFFRYALEGKDEKGKPVPGANRYLLAKKLLERQLLEHVGYLLETTT